MSRLLLGARLKLCSKARRGQFSPPGQVPVFSSVPFVEGILLKGFRDASQAAKLPSVIFMVGADQMQSIIAQRSPRSIWS